MKSARGLALVLAALLVAAAAAPAHAQHDRDGRRIDVRGVIVAINNRERSFVLREERRGEERFWLVEVLPGTRIEFGLERDDDDDGERIVAAGGRRPLRVGHIVAVEGRLRDERRIRARDITVIGLVLRLPPFPVRPPIGFPLRPPEIFFPQDGTEISTPEFVVVGRTVPGASVRIDVMSAWGFFQFQVAGADVTADEAGIFIATIRPTLRLSGGTYRITVRATASSITLPVTSLTVRVR